PAPEQTRAIERSANDGRPTNIARPGSARVTRQFPAARCADRPRRTARPSTAPTARAGRRRSGGAGGADVATEAARPKLGKARPPPRRPRPAKSARTGSRTATSRRAAGAPAAAAALAAITMPGPTRALGRAETPRVLAAAAMPRPATTPGAETACRRPATSVRILRRRRVRRDRPMRRAATDRQSAGRACWPASGPRSSAEHAVRLFSSRPASGPAVSARAARPRLRDRSLASPDQLRDPVDRRELGDVPRGPRAVRPSNRDRVADAVLARGLEDRETVLDEHGSIRVERPMPRERLPERGALLRRRDILRAQDLVVASTYPGDGSLHGDRLRMRVRDDREPLAEGSYRRQE